MKNIIGMKVSIRHHKRNLAKLKRKEPKTEKTLQAIKRTEEKIKKKLIVLEKVGVSPELERKPKKKKTDFGFGGYNKYINSKEWADRKSAYYEIHKKECRSCGHDEKEIHLHHRTYARIYQEDDSDLVAMCVDCHAMLHAFQKSLCLPVEDATRMWFEVTNETPDKKKIRASLRKVNSTEFGKLWKRRSKLNDPPVSMLSKTIDRILNKKLTPKDEVIDDWGSIKKSIAIVRHTGVTESYDARVDSIINRLERQRRMK